MITDPDALAALFTGTALAGLPVRTGPEGALVVDGVDPSVPGQLAAWRAARDLVPRTGRWPVLITDDHDRRPGADPEPPPADELAAFDEAARTTDPWADGSPWMHEPVGQFTDLVAGGVYGIDLDRLLSPPPDPAETFDQLERRSYAHVLADPGLTAHVCDTLRSLVRTDAWYRPGGVQVLLLPTGLPWLAARWVYLFDVHSERLAAVLFQWRERWGAELVAAWGTMLQFVVSRPPAPGEEAFALAGQIRSLATHLEMQQWELATVLPVGDAWFLHRRP
ncbi:hypothetical protein Val02_21130 [Virgisporangium aliadipatigenens]|uniref:DUF4253 domain-containing protein n=1 Tax=Virgisporangium aliadipatigenens TaxID=741659 RepID=A0A8J3YIV5_9ACTN|nr:DUF4253 domain-containing protein [Virgisporangium aliadipatigenens]GIJ45227.1 hypothetical protein Val02_21130 [Virgisporangium aliadipatigenens]